MTNASQPSGPIPPATYIRLPGIGVALFVVSPFLLLIGGITVLSTVSRDYFERAMTQCMVGSGMLMLGVAALMTAIVLAGMRTMAQQQLNIMLAAERGEHTPQV